MFNQSLAMKLALALSPLAILAGCRPTINIATEMRDQAAAIPISTGEQIGQREYSMLNEVVFRTRVHQMWSDHSVDASLQSKEQPYAVQPSSTARSSVYS